MNEKSLNNVLKYWWKGKQKKRYKIKTKKAIRMSYQKQWYLSQSIIESTWVSRLEVVSAELYGYLPIRSVFSAQRVLELEQRYYDVERTSFCISDKGRPNQSTQAGQVRFLASSKSDAKSIALFLVPTHKTCQMWWALNCKRMIRKKITEHSYVIKHLLFHRFQLAAVSSVVSIWEPKQGKIVAAPE